MSNAAGVPRRAETLAVACIAAADPYDGPMPTFALLSLLLAAAPAQPPYRGAARFSMGRGAGSVELIQHRDGSLVLQASDGRNSVACAEYRPGLWPAYRDYFARIAGEWFATPHTAFGSVDGDVTPYAGRAGLCDLSAFTYDYRVFLEVAKIERDVRTDYVRVEISPIDVSHSIRDVSSVQRAEDNTFGVRLAQAAAALATGLAGGTQSDTMPTLKALEGGIEDTRQYRVKVIDAHTDLALFVLVLDAYVAGGKLPTNEDIGAAYRIREMLGDDRPEVFFRVLARLANGEPSTQLMLRLRDCEDAVSCLDR